MRVLNLAIIKLFLKSLKLVAAINSSFKLNLSIIGLIIYCQFWSGHYEMYVYMYVVCECCVQRRS